MFFRRFNHKLLRQRQDQDVTHVSMLNTTWGCTSSQLLKPWECQNLSFEARTTLFSPFWTYTYFRDKIKSWIPANEYRWFGQALSVCGQTHTSGCRWASCAQLSRSYQRRIFSRGRLLPDWRQAPGIGKDRSRKVVQGWIQKDVLGRLNHEEIYKFL